MAGNGPSTRPDCYICGRTFHRSEHLKRHIATHTKEKPLRCHACDKGFNRRDALSRHEQVHNLQRNTSRKFRACENCAAARVKCSGKVPCARCEKRSISCSFPSHGVPNGATSPSSSRNSSGPGEQSSHDQHMPTARSGTESWPIHQEASSSTVSGNFVPWQLLNSETGNPLPSQAQSQHAGGTLQSPSQQVLPGSIVLNGTTNTQQSTENSSRLDRNSARAHEITQAYPIMEEADPFQQDHGGFGLQLANLDTNIISSFNWLSPSFDVGMEDLQYASTQMPGSGELLPPTYQWPLTQPAVVQNTSEISTTPNEDQDLTERGNTAETPDADGSYYVDGTGARRPRNGRYAKSLSQQTESPQVQSAHSLHVDEEFLGYMFPDEVLYQQSDVPEEATAGYHMDSRSYERLFMGFQELCVPGSVAFEAYSSPAFPPLAMFNRLIACYARFFDPVMPFLHGGATSSDSPWLLGLALAAVGSQYDDTSTLQTTVALHEFLRRAITKENAQSIPGFRVEAITITQAKLLNCVGMMYSGSAKLERHKVATLDDLVSIFQASYPDLSLSKRLEPGSQPEIQWRTWIQDESARRLGHCIWLLDCISKYHFQTRPRLLLDFASISLPCKEEMWGAKSSTTWSEVHEGEAATLEKALRILYVEKRLVVDTGDFARVILIHGLYCQTWEVAASLSRPLLRWTPSARKEDAESTELTRDIWLPKASSYGRWRNSACDCLDVLHWMANSDIANSGTENTTVLHLHFARIVLLTPFESITRLVSLLIHGGTHTSTTVQQERLLVQRWIMEDQYKARLACIHAGVEFWHVRRYSTDAFYESTNIFLATIVLWAYGSFCPRVERPSSRNREGSESTSDSASISSIRLDRPTDDELVQLFVKKGRSMKATITGVGNITGPRGPLRMLKEGCKLLAVLDKWAIRDKYIGILSSLAATYEGWT